MWSHYSRNHRGVCLEFEVSKQTKFVAAQRVRYQREYPPLLLHEPESHYKMLLIKSDAWAYEQEFRLICPRFTDIENMPLLMDGDFLSIGPNDLKSIIVGCQASEESTVLIIELAQKHAPGVAVRQAKRSPKDYRLIIDNPPTSSAPVPS
jgi:hypothetical protein